MKCECKSFPHDEECSEHPRHSLVRGNEKLRADNERLVKCVVGFKEYLEAIENGEYPNSRPELRSFEMVLLTRARNALKHLDGQKE